MIKFTFTVHNEMGLLTRPAGQLVKEAMKCSSKVTVQKGEKQGNAKSLFSVMALDVKGNEEVGIVVEGDKEEREAAALKAYLSGKM